MSEEYVNHSGLMRCCIETLRQRTAPANHDEYQQCACGNWILYRFNVWRRDRQGATTFTCPVCGRTSYHPEDVRHGYCGNCHAFTGSLPDRRDK